MFLDSVDLCGFLFPAFPATLLCCLSSVAHLIRMFSVLVLALVVVFVCAADEMLRML